MDNKEQQNAKENNDNTNEKEKDSKRIKNSENDEYKENEIETDNNDTVTKNNEEDTKNHDYLSFSKDIEETEVNDASVNSARTISTPYVYKSPKLDKSSKNSSKSSTGISFTKNISLQSMIEITKKYYIHYVLLSLFYIIFLICLIFCKFRIIFITLLVVISLIIPKYRSYAIIITLTLFAAIVISKKKDQTFNEFIGLSSDKREILSLTDFVYQNKFLINIDTEKINYSKNLDNIVEYVKKNLDINNMKKKKEIFGFFISLDLQDWKLIDKETKIESVDSGIEWFQKFINDNREKIQNVNNVLRKKYKKELAIIIVCFDKDDDVKRAKNSMKNIMTKELYDLIIFE